MDDLNRSISQHLKSGQYYKDAHKWYANKFVFKATERAYIILFLVMFIISFSVLGGFYYAFDPSARQIRYLKTLPDINEEYSVIKSIGNKIDLPQVSVEKYMLKKYVIERESYKFSQIKSHLSFMQQSNSNSEYQKYADYISINNPSSPIMLYQDSNERLIKVKEVKIIESDDQHALATVHFKSILINLSTNSSVSDDLVATISYKIDDIKTIINKKEDQLKFLVLNYIVSKDN